MKMIISTNRILSFVFTVILLISSCAQYDTQYTPPKSDAGMNCVNTCIIAKQSCISNCEISKNADRMASIAQSAITRNQYNTYTPYRGDCGCTQQYNDCYRSCGGKVNTICISGCK